jgi:hypothetical protein
MPYHRECFLVAGAQSCHSVAAATYPGLPFEGYQRLEHRRRRWLKDTFARDLFQVLRGRVPQEVCGNIAVYFARERAMRVSNSIGYRTIRSGKETYQSLSTAA